MKYIGPILYKGKLTNYGTGIDPEVKVNLREGALVFAHADPYSVQPIPVGTIDWIWDHGDEVWAALDIETMPPAEKDVFPQPELEHVGGNLQSRGHGEAWFVGEITIRSIHLGAAPAWEDLPPVKPS